MKNISDLPVKEVFPGFVGRFIHGENSTVAIWEIKAGSRVPMHQHVHEQTTHVVSGELDMTIGGQTYSFTPGTIHVIPSNVKHNAFAITDCKVIDYFSPVREDYRF